MSLDFDKLSNLIDHVNSNGLDLITELSKFDCKRSLTIKSAIKYLDKHKPQILIETGTSRGSFHTNLKSMCGDGASTLFFAIWCSKNNACLYTVDIDPKCIESSKKNIEILGLSNYVNFVCSDSVKFLENVNLSDLQFIYFDSYDFDFNNPIPSQIHHLNEYNAVKSKLSSIVVF